MTDRLDAIQTFVAVADAHGFARAGRALGLHPSIVTRQVAALEARLGTRLLQRTTRTVRLTDAGSRFLERARGILAALEEAELSAQEERAAPVGRLVVAAPLLFGRMHVAPIVTALLEQHAGLRASLELSDRMVNLVEEGVDVAVRIGRLADTGLIARRLGQTGRVLVASPAYLARHGTPGTPGELAGHALIAFSALTPTRTWRFGPGPGGSMVDVPVEPRFETNNGEAAIAASVGGGGITAALGYQVEAALRAGALVEVLAAYRPAPMPIHAMFPSSRLLSAKVRAFLVAAEQAGRGWRFEGPPRAAEGQRGR